MNESVDVPVISIDGPSGSGKGTVSYLLAKKLGWHLLDSGALYRVLAVAAKMHGVALGDQQALAALALGLDVVFRPKTDEPACEVVLEGRLVDEEIRTEITGEQASVVAAYSDVRGALLGRQRAFREPPGLVADGRDMGTVVFPGAVLKIFLTASAEERAKRRYNQLKQKGFDVSLRDLFEDIRVRDERDANRKVSPLRPAPDAIVLDCTELTVEEVFAATLAEVKRKGMMLIE